MSRKQFCEDLDQALQQLPEAFRIVVMLADVEGLSYKEVCRDPALPHWHRHVAALSRPPTLAQGPMGARTAQPQSHPPNS